MEIKINNADTLYAISKVAFDVYRKLRDDGTLAELGNDLLNIGKKLWEQNMGMEISAYHAYIDAGIPPEMAQTLLLARRLQKEELRISVREHMRELLKTVGK